MHNLLMRAGRILPALLVLILILAATGPAAAQPAEKPTASDAQLLIDTIENPDSRQKLIGQLKLIAEAGKTQKAQSPQDQGLLAVLSDQVARISDAVLTTVASLSDLRRLAAWVQDQAASPELRARWADILLKLSAILAGGLVAERAVMILLARPTRYLGSRVTPRFLARLPLVAGVLVLQLLPILAFLFAAQSLQALPVLGLSGGAAGASVLVNTAYALSRLALVCEMVLLSPASPTLRPLPLDDETANYLFIWGRRLTLTGFWGYFLAEALRLLGLPRPSYLFALKLLGLLLATLVIILVLQNRAGVSAWIRARGGERLGSTLKTIRNRLAEVWHILAILYVVALFFIWALPVKGGVEYILRASGLTVVVFVLANLAASFASKMVVRLFSVGEDLRQRFPQLEGRANRYMAIMQNVIRVTLYLATLLALAQAWGADTLGWLTSGLGRRLASGAVSIAAVLLAALIIWEFVNASIERYLDGQGAQAASIRNRSRTLLPLARNVVMVVLIVVVSLIILSEIGVNIAPLLAGAGVVGVAIGFGSQKLVQDVITGAFILFEDTLAVGDVVKISGFSGVVEGMTIRTLRLRDQTGQIHTLPFSAVGAVSNMTRDFGYHVFDIGIAYRENVAEVTEVLKTLGEELRADPAVGESILEPVEVLGVESLADSAVILRGRIKTHPGKQWAAGRRFNAMIKERFDELGIEIPFPHTTLYFGVDKKGEAPPANLRLSGSLETAMPKTGEAGA